MFLALCWGPVWASRVPGGSETMEAHEDSQARAGLGAGSESQHLQQCLHMGSKQEGLGPQGSRKGAANVVGWAGLVPGRVWVPGMVVALGFMDKKQGIALPGGI